MEEVIAGPSWYIIFSAADHTYYTCHPMATIQDRSFSRDYNGLRSQFAVGGVLAAVCLMGYELMRRMRRGRGLRPQGQTRDGVDSVETWEFGYLYQGRCWAQKPSPALPKWPLAWVKQTLQIPERTLPELLGVDATLYIRFLRACWWFTALHTCTTFPVLFSIHILFSPSDISLQLMDKASISSLVLSPHGLRLVFVHVILAYWITVTWVLALLWVARGTFRYRSLLIQRAAETITRNRSNETPGEQNDEDRHGLRLRTIMVTNVPAPLRNEKALKEYLEYHMSRPLGTAPITPGFIPKMMTFLFNRAAASSAVQHFMPAVEEEVRDNVTDGKHNQVPAIVERVVIARKMTELASLLERRMEVLMKLEYAHVKLACKALKAARFHHDHPVRSTGSRGPLSRLFSPRSWVSGAVNSDHRDEESAPAKAGSDLGEQLNLVTETLAPFVSEFHVPSATGIRENLSRIRHYGNIEPSPPTDSYPPSSPETRTSPQSTVWEALHSLPRACLDAYQPLIYLSRLFRGQTVPAIDYYGAKLGLLTALINENRGRPLDAYPPSSTVFVTFEKIEDARRAARYLHVHPRNPMACLVVPAPDVADLDWGRVMKSSFTGEFLKDWVIDLGVWTFTCSWIIPISLLVGLVNIQNLGIFIPGLQKYLQKHPRDQEAISSLLPTLLVSLLTILVPVILLLIAKKGHTIITFSKLHDTIMIRYWKFLICNLLIFFCVGVSALESFLQSFRSSVNPLPLIASSFPTAGPFYVGWLILQTAFHGFLELGLLYPSTRAATTLRRRAASIRPRTFNFYYWVPNHVLVMTIVVCFALLNPLVIPFAWLYFSVQSVIVKHQLVHVYAKTYDNNGQIILIRVVRYSLDGLILAHVVFLAFLLFLRETPEAALTGVLLGLTVITKIGLTRLCRAKFAETTQAEDSVYSGGEQDFTPPDIANESEGGGVITSRAATLGSLLPYGSSRFWTWKVTPGPDFSYEVAPARPLPRRPAIPFGRSVSFTRITSDEKPERPPQLEIPRDTEASNAYSDKNAEGAASTDSPRLLGPPFHGTLLTRRNTAGARRTVNTSIVTPHAKHAPWDDFPHLNRPYENPFYVAPIDNFLWLPRNPFGVLDLDDSVDMHQSLTSELGAGELGRWMNETAEAPLSLTGDLVETPSTMPSRSPDSNHSDSVHGGFPFNTGRHLSGAEHISLSSVLSERVSRLEREDDIDRASAQRSTISRSGYGRRMSIALRHSSSDWRQSGLTHSASQPLPPFLGRSVSGRSAASKLQISPQRLRSTSHDPVNEPDLQAEAVFMDSSFSVPVSLHGTTGRASRLTHRHERATGPPVPMRDAVVGEIIAEERVEAMERIRLETEEQRLKDAQKPSWWNSWLWHRRPPSVHRPEGATSDNT
ncbi:hypothetical protein JB92DRAFT_3102097 [Gautieria morchelliformis]|nr:hypothetical protein JB92DRAFT_3102097 [Gautieria morchelliformis]